MRNAVTGAELPGRHDAEGFYRRVLAECRKDVLFRSRESAWCREKPGRDGLDYLWLALAGPRNAGVLPNFSSAANAAAYVLSLPPPEGAPFMADPATIRVRLSGDGGDVYVSKSQITAVEKIAIGRYSVTLADGRRGTAFSSNLEGFVP